MKRYSIAQVKMAALKKPGLWQEVLSRGFISRDQSTINLPDDIKIALGFGDRVAALLDPIGGMRFKLWRQHSGRACRCPERQQRLNRLGRAITARWKALLNSLASLFQ